MSSVSPSHHHSSHYYSRLTLQEIEQEHILLLKTSESCDATWTKEVETYEHFDKNGDNDNRDNHEKHQTAFSSSSLLINSKILSSLSKSSLLASSSSSSSSSSIIKIRDGIFPYHSSMYPLLDMYYTLANDVIPFLTLSFYINPPSHVYDVIRRKSNENEVLLEGYMPCSAYAVRISLFSESMVRSTTVTPTTTAATTTTATTATSTTTTTTTTTKRPAIIQDRNHMDSTDFSFLDDQQCWIENNILKFFSDDTIRLPRFGKKIVGDDDYDVVEFAVNDDEHDDDEHDDDEHDEYDDDDWIDHDEDEDDGSWIDEYDVTDGDDDGDNDGDNSDVIINAEYPTMSQSEKTAVATPTNSTAIVDVDVLLRLLRHSTSDLQRDHRLARAVLLKLVQLQCFEYNNDDNEVVVDDNNDTEKKSNSSNKKNNSNIDNDDGDCHNNDKVNDDNDDNTNGIDILRRLLSILAVVKVNCEGHCHLNFIRNNPDYNSNNNNCNIDELPDHYCNDWKYFNETIPLLFAYGIKQITRRHASTLVAFVSTRLEDAGFKSALIEKRKKGNSSNSASGTTNKNSNGLGASRVSKELSTDWEDNVPQLLVSGNMVWNVIEGIVVHVCLDRIRIVEYLRRKYRDEKSSDDDDDDFEVKNVVTSFWNCVIALVKIGEELILRLPSCDQSAVLGGLIVKGLHLSCGSVPEFDLACSFRTGYMGNRSIEIRSSGSSGSNSIDNDYYDRKGGKKTLIDPSRYADVVGGASDLQRQRSDTARKSLFPGRSNEPQATNTVLNDPIFLSVFQKGPPDDVQDIVRALFLRQMVDLSISGCGYGDWLVWCHLPLTPFEPLLYDRELNYLREDDSDEGGEDWVLNEEGKKLTLGQLDARYDFTLLMLNNIWNASWTPESHASFHQPFQLAIRTITLVTHKTNLPLELLRSIISFLPRQWWAEDDRRNCWYYDCQLRSLLQSLRMKAAIVVEDDDCSRKDGGLSSIIQRTRNISKKKICICSGCMVVSCCSNKHLKYLNREGHKRVCGFPPLRAPCVEDDDICQEIMSNDSIPSNSNVDGSEKTGGSESDESLDEESSWESIASDEDMNIPVMARSRTDIIYSFFQNKAYKEQRVEEHAFSSFYNDEE